MTIYRIAHLSDPHFGTVEPPVRAALLERLHELKPNLVLISGDITQRAHRSQFREARAFRNDLAPIATFAVPGNHDLPLFNLPSRIFRPYAEFRGVFQDHREVSMTRGDVHVIGLNSTSRWRHVQGRLNLPRIRERLFEARDRSRVRIVAVHHPLDCAKRIDDHNLLVGRESAMELFEEAEIDLVLSGHVHDPFVGLSSTRYAAAHRPMILTVAGTCLSWRTRKGAPNSFNLIDIDTGSDKAPAVSPTISIVRYDFDGDAIFRARDDWTHDFVREDGRWKGRVT